MAKIKTKKSNTLLEAAKRGIQGGASPAVAAALSPTAGEGTGASVVAEAAPKADWVPFLAAVGIFLLSWLWLGWRWWIAAIVAVVAFFLVRWWRNR